MRNFFGSWTGIAVYAILSGLIMSFYYCHKKNMRSGGSSTGKVIDGLYVSPASREKQRVERLLPTKASEDVSHLLKNIKREHRVVDGVREDIPDERVDWVIDIQPKDAKAFSERAAFNALRVERWCQVYGKDAHTGLWTSCWERKDKDLQMTGLAVAKPLFVPSSDFKEPTLDELNEFLGRITTQARTLGDVTVRPRFSAGEAIEKMRKIRAFSTAEKNAFNQVMVVLQSQARRPFSGKEIWDVMLCLGIEWGDMDLFYYNNTPENADEHFFAVWTTTDPGYFLPESIAKGQKYDSLVFGMEIASNEKPVEVYQAMMLAVGYAQKRLGGEIRDHSGEPLDEAALLARIEERARKLEQAGYPAGSSAAFRATRY